MPNVGSPHAACVNRLNHFFVTRLGTRGVVHVHNPVRLDRYTEASPDLAVLKPRDDFYACAYPVPEDVYLIVEVSEDTLQADRAAKVPMYAQAGILDVWMVDLGERAVEIYRDPTSTGWRHLARKMYTDTWTLTAFPDLRVTGADMFG